MKEEQQKLEWEEDFRSAIHYALFYLYNSITKNKKFPCPEKDRKQITETLEQIRGIIKNFTNK